MKAKITIRNILFLVFSVIVLCSVMCLSASAVEGTYDCPHDLGENGWTIIAEPNCTEGGTRSKWCKDCGDYKLEYIDKDPDAHTPGLWTVIEEHSCQKAGREAIFCTKCKVYKFEERVIPAHDYKVLYKEEATCMKAGYELHVCMTCYDMQTKTLPIDKENGHSFTEWQITKEANCVQESGEKFRRCLCRDEDGKQCDKTEYMTYTDLDCHIENDWSGDDVTEVSATCSAPGYYSKKCVGCDNEITKEIPQHSQSTVASIISTVPATCKATGVEKRKCICGAVYDFELPLEPDSHVYSEWITEKEPGCTAGKRYKYCKYHYNTRIEESIPANGEHNYGEWVSVIEPDCTKTGLDKKTCADCGDVVTRELPVKHNLTIWETKVEMSCAETNAVPGSKLAKCSDCTYENHFAIPALHNYGTWVIVTASDCKKQNEGRRERTCAGCGKVESETFVKAHDYTDWYVTAKPTCAVDGKSGIEGQRTRWCRTCNSYEHEVIPVTHEFVDVEIIKYPVCSSNGMVEDGVKSVECIHCGLVKENAVIEGGHTFSEWVTDVEPTCDADKKQLVDGSESRSCVVCGFKETRKVDGAHTYGNWYWSTSNGETCGTYSETGITLYRECEKCNLRDSKTVNTIKHPNLKTVTTAATCSTSGYTTELCPDCGYSKVSNIQPAYGHKLDKNWTSKVAASCTTAGSRYKACENCDYLEYQYIEKTEHVKMALEANVDPTCTEAGKRGKAYCAVCQEVFEGYEIPALGHEYAEGSEICTRCGAYEGSRDCTCSCHSQSGMEKIFFELINKLYQFFGINQVCKCGDLHYTEFGFFAKLLGKG